MAQGSDHPTSILALKILMLKFFYEIDKMTIICRSLHMRQKSQKLQKAIH